MKSDRKTFKEMLNLCYEQEEFEELHVELMSLEAEVKQEKEPHKYKTAMRELLNIIPLFADDFPLETLSQIEKIYQEFLENE